MTQEQELALISSAATELTQAVLISKAAVDNAVALFSGTTAKVNNELNLVDNTADADKIISDAVAVGLGLKQNNLVDGDNISTVNGNSLLSGVPLVIARGQVEIPVLSYENRGSLRTPVLPVPLTGDVVNIAHLGHFQYNTVLEYVDDDEMAFKVVHPDSGTIIGEWVLTLPAYEWTQAQEMFEDAVKSDFMEDYEERHKEIPH
jgi:hypothetical protein